jgi:hypothetical protein
MYIYSMYVVLNNLFENRYLSFVFYWQKKFKNIFENPSHILSSFSNIRFLFQKFLKKLSFDRRIFFLVGFQILKIYASVIYKFTLLQKSPRKVKNTVFFLGINLAHPHFFVCINLLLCVRILSPRYWLFTFDEPHQIIGF